MVSRYGSPQEKSQVDSAVARKYPGMGGGADPKKKVANAMRKRKSFSPPDPSALGSG